MDLKKLTAGVGLIMAASFTLSACSGNTKPSSGVEESAEGIATLQVGLLPNIDVLPIYVGTENGAFAKHNLVIEPVQAQGGAALLPAVLEGSIDIAYSNVLTPLTASERGLEVTLVSGAPLTVSPETLKPQGDHPSSILAVASDSKIKSAADLAGKTVSVNALGGIQEIAVRNSVEAAGGDPDSVELLELPLSQAEGALSAGRVDAVSVNEPFTTAVLQAGHRIIGAPFTDFDYPSSNVGVYFSTTKFAEENQDVIQRFRDAMDEVNEYLNENPEQAREGLAGYTEIEDSLRSEVSLPYFQSQINLPSMEEIMQKGVRFGALEAELDLKPIVGDVPNFEGTGK